MLVVQSFFRSLLDRRGLRRLNNPHADPRFIKDVTSASRQACLSNKFLKKHGYSTALYTDEYSAPYFKSSGHDSVFIVDLFDYFQQFAIPDDFWSASKLIVCLMVHEPFWHIDLDFFLIHDVLSEQENKQALFLHYEPWYTLRWQALLKQINNVFPDITASSKSHNAAVFGGSDYSLIHSSVSKLLTGLSSSRQELDRILSLVRPRVLDNRSVFLEQFILPNLIKPAPHIVLPDSDFCDDEQSVYKLLKSKGVLHLWTYKRYLNGLVGLDEFVEMLDKRHFGF